MKSEANTAQGTPGPIKVTIRRRGNKKLELVVGLVMALVGFSAALAVGYGALPTFLYESGGVLIHDKSVADTSGERPVLRRTLRMSTPAADSSPSPSTSVLASAIPT